MAQKKFFGTVKDLTKGLHAIESKYALTYTLCGTFDSMDIVKYNSIFEYEKLGFHQSGNHALNDKFLVTKIEEEIKIRRIIQQNGNMRYGIDQLENQNSIVFEGGGIYEEKYLVHGLISSSSNSPVSSELFRLFSKEVLQGFKKVNGWYVGEEALELFEKGWRLITISIESPEEFDLKIK